MDPEGNIAVVGVLFDTSVDSGSENPFIANFFEGYLDRFNKDASSKK